MSTKILFVFEGQNAEDQIVFSLKKQFDFKNTTIESVYGAEIYQIYKQILEDDDLDTFNLVKERNYTNKDKLASYTRADFAEIYLFFDYDGHSSLADDSKLIALLEFFNEETDKGKLYISYPMVEALKHIDNFETFKDLHVECKRNINYKNIVSNSAMKELINFNSYYLETWKKLITIHLKKMNFIVNDSFTLPDNIIPQKIILNNQIEKYINSTSRVAVLSAFPVFIHDYYGNEGIKKRIE